MIYELNPSQFKSISHLLEGERINLEIKAVVEGYNPGWVFVDNVMEPNTAMVWSQGIKGFYFLGEAESNEFNSSLITYIKYIIAPRARKQNINAFEFSGTSALWDKKLEQIFKNLDLSISKQFVYRRPVELDLDEAVISLDADYSIEKVDKALLSKKDLNLELVEQSVREWWGNVGNFGKHGIGFCIVHNKEAICSCVASSFDGHEVQSHIVTRDDFRKKGLATVAVAEFVREGKSRSLELYWDCMEKNAGSRALAEKLGYVKSYEYNLYEFPL